MKHLTLAASLLLTSTAFATQPAPVANVASVMNGTVMVGTNVSAGVGQAQSQISTASLTGSSTLSLSGSVPTIANSITGTAASTATGNGYVSPTWNIVDSHGATQGVSAISTGTVVTTVVDYPIATSTITPGHDHD
jgi:hypothetical protein